MAATRVCSGRVNELVEVHTSSASLQPAPHVLFRRADEPDGGASSLESFDQFSGSLTPNSVVVRYHNDLAYPLSEEVTLKGSNALPRTRSADGVDAHRE
ncbi:hypothetical protein [Planctomycetes bacterium Poly30]|uniref:hypothetical protein n=1 Tax=Saltatorellus ferox TaxID=2528018 RepID=UPI00119DBC6B